MKINRRLLIILAISVLLRLGVALYLGNVVDAPALLTDQRSYHALGSQLMNGDGFTFPTGWYPFTPANTPTAHWSFLYSLFVAAVYGIFGAYPLAVRSVQAVLGGILLPWMVFRLARELFTPKAGELGRVANGVGRSSDWVPDEQVTLVAALWAAVYPYFVLYAATLMTETFYIVALLWSLEVALRIGDKLRRRQSVPWRAKLELGISLGVATILRQSVLPWVPVLFVWLFFQLARSYDYRLSSIRLKEMSTFLIPGLILMGMVLPWTIRNFSVYDEFLLLNSNTGYAMYSGQHPMHGTRFREFEAAPLPEDLGPSHPAWGNEARMNRELMQRGLGFVIDEPMRYVRLSLSRVRAYFEFWPTRDTTLSHNIGRVASFGLALPAMIYGFYIALNNTVSASTDGDGAIGEQHDTESSEITMAEIDTGPSPDQRLIIRHDALMLILGFVVFYSVLHIFTWAMVRYRLPVDAVAMPFASLAIVDLYRRVSGGVGTQRDPASWLLDA